MFTSDIWLFYIIWLKIQNLDVVESGNPLNQRILWIQWDVNYKDKINALELLILFYIYLFLGPTYNINFKIILEEKGGDQSILVAKIL